MLAKLRIAIVAYEGVSLLDLSGPLETFHVASFFAGENGSKLDYECVIVSSQGGVVTTSAGVKILTKPIKVIRGLEVDTLIIPGACLVEEVTRDLRLVEWVRRIATRCRRVCSVCVGSFLLAEAGLLDGKRAATHWRHTGLFASRYPNVVVETDAIYVRDGKMWTSAGVTTGIDLALALIEQDSGRKAAMQVARNLVVYLRRSGGQSQYSALLAAQTESDHDVFSKLELWISENLDQDLSVEKLARRVHMSPRNFARVYAAKRGKTPAKAVEAVRVDAARRLLEDTDLRIQEIAAQSGFKNEERMRTAFMRYLSLSPKEYRNRFSVLDNWK